MTPKGKPSGRQVLLLRGINVGGQHRVPMGDLRSVLAQLGYTDARTHLQSGNVVLTTGEASRSVADAVARQLERTFGFAIPVMVRTADEMAAVVAADLLREVASDPARYVVTFLDALPSAEAVQSVRAQDFSAERWQVLGREVYQWCPGGQHESPLVKALARAGVTTAGTSRNWRTVARLAEMSVS